MFPRFRELSLLERETNRAIRGLVNHPIGSDEYNKELDQVIKLHKMVLEENPSVDKNTWAIIGANLLGILLIIRHENVNVIMSRATNLIMTPRSKF